jgi:hypothetical protein
VHDSFCCNFLRYGAYNDFDEKYTNTKRFKSYYRPAIGLLSSKTLEQPLKHGQSL